MNNFSLDKKKYNFFLFVCLGNNSCTRNKNRNNAEQNYKDTIHMYQLFIHLHSLDLLRLINRENISTGSKKDKRISNGKIKSKKTT